MLIGRSYVKRRYSVSAATLEKHMRPNMAVSSLYPMTAGKMRSGSRINQVGPILRLAIEMGDWVI